MSMLHASHEYRRDQRNAERSEQLRGVGALERSNGLGEQLVARDSAAQMDSVRWYLSLPT
jgi:hypothetical protein